MASVRQFVRAGAGPCGRYRGTDAAGHPHLCAAAFRRAAVARRRSAPIARERIAAEADLLRDAADRHRAGRKAPAVLHRRETRRRLRQQDALAGATLDLGCHRKPACDHRLDSQRARRGRSVLRHQARQRRAVAPGAGRPLAHPQSSRGDVAPLPGAGDGGGGAKSRSGVRPGRLRLPGHAGATYETRRPRFPRCAATVCRRFRQAVAVRPDWHFHGAGQRIAGARARRARQGRTPPSL